MNEMVVFETRIFIFNCELNTDSVYKSIKDHQKITESVSKSNFGGYQGHYFSNPSLQKEIKKNLPQNSNKPIKNYTLQAWVNINTKGNWNDMHNHCDSNVVLSGIYYVKVPDNSGGVRFYDPRRNSSKLYHQYYEDGKGNYLRLIPKENLMIFFPPWLEHLVEPSQVEEERVSVAFNITDPS